jgi:hypothetical protein
MTKTLGPPGSRTIKGRLQKILGVFVEDLEIISVG